MIEPQGNCMVFSGSRISASPYESERHLMAISSGTITGSGWALAEGNNLCVIIIREEQVDPMAPTTITRIRGAQFQNRSHSGLKSNRAP